MGLSRKTQRLQRHSEAGFTLLELLLVVAILSSLALAATTFVDNADNQERFEVTRSRLEQIRFAVVGNSLRAANGQTELSGFVADMGRLPANLRELIEPADCDHNTSGDQACPAWAYEANSGLWAGWHGPYISVLAESSGARAYRDGWGNAGAAPNYAWKFIPSDRDGLPVGVPDNYDNTLQVQSYGSDGSTANADPGSYDEEYPSTGNLVELYDHQVNVKGWSVTVSFFNPPAGAGTIPASATQLYLRLCYPANGVITATSPKVISTAATLNPVNDGLTAVVTFTFPPGTDAYVPIGMRSLRVTDDAGSDCTASNYGAANQSLLMAFVPRVQLPVNINQIWQLE